MAHYLPGDVVLTSYGVGVVTRCPSRKDSDGSDDSSSSSSFYVRLWRIPNRSIGSSTQAYIQPNAIVKKLPAAPGMVTYASIGPDKKRQKIVVQCYYSSRDSFLVDVVPEGEGDGDGAGEKSMELYPEDIETASCAKFYPLLEELMIRGDRAASLTAALLQDEKVTKVVEKSTKLIEVKTEEAAAKLSQQNMEKLTTSIVPDPSDMKQVYNMLKDEELTVLLEKGKERLEQLMSQRKQVSEATQKVLREAGIVIDNGIETPTTFQEAVTKSRDSALKSLKAILSDEEQSDLDLDEIRDKLEGNFVVMFDSLAQAARSDRTLASIFETISGKTSAWQEATGRLLSTKSGSLFMEGASRLQARAAELFSTGQLSWAGEVGSKMIKAFTEGDAAVARLKSIELGDAVRSRLVSAIEVRSGSHGGLDGIIAGALTTVTKGGEASGDQMQSMLLKLQKSASSATKDAHETLIAVLSRKSEYRDVALLRIENVLCQLESYLGEELSPEEIAVMAEGEGGTSALFEPIAKRASKEIQKHLDHAESTITDPTILAALDSVRKILSGELSLSGLMDEMVQILNDDKIVAAGESLVKHGEIALDAIEGISGNRLAGDVLKVAEKAGITKESVMSQIESLNMNELLDTAGSAVTDEKARRELVSSATDTALDFVLRILPSMPVPPYDGVREGLVYHLSNLSMKGFKVKKENIAVEVAGMRATKNKDALPPAQGKELTPDEAYETVIEDNMITFKKKDETAIKATELLIIDVRGISAILDDVEWKFEQTYMPYLKGGGKANVKLSDGSIRLQFELRKRQVVSPDSSQDEEQEAEPTWEPVLCLHDRSCSIERIELVLQGEGRLTWIFNKLASVFKGVLRDYVVKTIINILTSKSGYILEKLNENLAPYWGLIMKTTSLKLDDLIVADRKVITAAQPDQDDSLIELVWKESLPLGMNLLLNDESGKLKVVDFPRGSQARKVCMEKELDPAAFNGATIVAVNGTRYELQEDLFGALKNPGRPKSILFELAETEDAERVKRFVEASKKKKEKQEKKTTEATQERIFFTRTVVVPENMDIGLEFAPAIDDFGLIVKGFVPGEDGIVLAAERDGNVREGDLLTHINGTLVLGDGGQGKLKALELLESQGKTRPLTLTFTDSYLFSHVIEKPDDCVTDLGGPTELILEEKNKRIYLRGFENVGGAAETGDILIGDHLVFVNGNAVGAGCGKGRISPELDEVYAMLTDANMHPLALTFARPQQRQGNRWATPTKQSLSIQSTICIAADVFDDIGCIFESKGPPTNIIVTDFFTVPGFFQKSLKSHSTASAGKVPLAIEEINGQFVPSYASCSIVMNAMKRSWSSSEKLEVLLCDDERKQWVHALT